MATGQNNLLPLWPDTSGQECYNHGMGIDLKALASNFRERRDEMLATASLRFDRDHRILSAFSSESSPCIVQAMPPGLKVGHHDDEGLRFDDKDKYGYPLTFTTPEQLRLLPAIEQISDWNRAILAFLLTLPSGTRIVLYWC